MTADNNTPSDDATAHPRDALVDGLTLSAKVAAVLRERILSGELSPGAQLASEQQLMRELAVSRTTVRGALEQLQREGLIVKQQGLRSIVRPRRVQQTLARLETLDKVITEQGLSSATKIIKYSFDRPTPQVQAALELDDHAEVLLVRRVHSGPDGPIAVVDIAVPAELAAVFSRKDVEEHSFYYLLPTRRNVSLGRAIQTFRAETVSAEDAEMLQVAEGAAVLVCDRVTQSMSGDLIVWASFRYRGDRYEFQAALEVHERQVPWAVPGIKLLGAV